MAKKHIGKPNRKRPSHPEAWPNVLAGYWREREKRKLNQCGQQQTHPAIAGPTARPPAPAIILSPNAMVEISGWASNRFITDASIILMSVSPAAHALGGKLGAHSQCHL